MTRMDFLKQLEYLLQDIDEKDREDALDYYRDYMDEAGISEFASVDGLLDTPEKIAISIRASLNSDDETQSEFSEQGVQVPAGSLRNICRMYIRGMDGRMPEMAGPSQNGRRHGRMRKKQISGEKMIGEITWAKFC